MKLDLEDYTKEVKSKALELIERFGILNLIYLRVSTENEGQQEKDQLPEILSFFKLKEEECLIIEAEESGYQIWKQKSRKFQAILDLIQDLDFEIPKKIYFFSISRIYRNRQLTLEFYNIAEKTNTTIYCRLEYFINTIAEISISLPKDMKFIIDMMVNQLVNLFAWMAEMESKHKGDMMRKSMKKGNDNRTYSNKGKLWGKKLTDSTGKKLKLSGDQLNMIERVCKQMILKGITYRDIQNEFLKKKNIKLSLGYLNKVKHKDLNTLKTIN